MSLKRPLSPSASSETYESDLITDRSSTFIALYSRTTPARALQSTPSIASASHRMLAWRVPSSQRSITPNTRLYESGHDDDGEKYGGARLQKLLESMDARGAVVVARWYGGVMLGPVRFAHIEGCAREAIMRARDGTEGKRARVEEDEGKSKANVVDVLKRRDQSITTLRRLLTEKKADVAGVNSQVSSASHVKQMDYQSMELDVLQRLEKARDSTLAFILKQIDKVEAEVKASESLRDTIDASSGKSSHPSP